MIRIVKTVKEKATGRKIRKIKKKRKKTKKALKFINNTFCMAITKITATMEDGSTLDFVAPVPVVAPTQTVTLASGETLEVKAA